MQNELKNNDSDSSIDESLNQESQSKLSEGLYEKNLVRYLILDFKSKEKSIGFKITFLFIYSFVSIHIFGLNIWSK